MANGPKPRTSRSKRSGRSTATVDLCQSDNNALLPFVHLLARQAATDSVRRDEQSLTSSGETQNDQIK